VAKPKRRGERKLVGRYERRKAPSHAVDSRKGEKEENEERGASASAVVRGGKKGEGKGSSKSIEKEKKGGRKTGKKGLLILFKKKKKGKKIQFRSNPYKKKKKKEKEGGEGGKKGGSRGVRLLRKGKGKKKKENQSGYPETAEGEGEGRKLKEKKVLYAAEEGKREETRKGSIQQPEKKKWMQNTAFIGKRKTDFLRKKKLKKKKSASPCIKQKERGDEKIPLILKGGETSTHSKGEENQA